LCRLSSTLHDRTEPAVKGRKGGSAPLSSSASTLPHISARLGGSVPPPPPPPKPPGAPGRHPPSLGTAAADACAATRAPVGGGLSSDSFSRCTVRRPRSRAEPSGRLRRRDSRAAGQRTRTAALAECIAERATDLTGTPLLLSIAAGISRLVDSCSHLLAALTNELAFAAAPRTHSRERTARWEAPSSPLHPLRSLLKQPHRPHRGAWARSCVGAVPLVTALRSLR